MISRKDCNKAFNVWEGLLIRETLSRVFSSKTGWFWLFAEPIFLITLLVAIRSAVNLSSSIYGLPTEVWLAVGLTAFFMFRDGLFRAHGAIVSNKALYNYRQLKPIDTVLARTFLEGLVRVVVLIVILSSLSLMGFLVKFDSGLEFIGMWSLLWFLTMGFALVFSVLISLNSDIDKILRPLGLPLLFISGVIFPFQTLPVWIQDWMLFNPILNAIELLRSCISDSYVLHNEISFTYVLLWALGMNILGLALHLKHEQKIRNQ